MERVECIPDFIHVLQRLVAHLDVLFDAVLHALIDVNKRLAVARRQGARLLVSMFLFVKHDKPSFFAHGSDGHQVSWRVFFIGRHVSLVKHTRTRLDSALFRNECAVDLACGDCYALDSCQYRKVIVPALLVTHATHARAALYVIYARPRVMLASLVIYSRLA